MSGWSSPRTRRYRVRVSSSRVRACWYSPNAAGRGRGCWPRRGCRGDRRRAGRGGRRKRAGTAAGLRGGRRGSAGRWLPGPAARHASSATSSSRAVGRDGGEHVRQEGLPVRPYRRVVPHVAGKRRTQQPRPTPVGQALRVGAGAGAQQSGGNTVQLHAVRGDGGHPAAMKKPGTVGERQRIGDRPARSLSGSTSGCSVNRLSGTGSGAHHANSGQQIQGDGVVGGQTVERDSPGAASETG